MTVVIADTSPLNYLLLIGEIAILPRLYGQVLIPPEVLAELCDPSAPPEVLQWVRLQPIWLQTRQVRTLHDVQHYCNLIQASEPLFYSHSRKLGHCC
jgi:predicted nucleic acid-binding protein